MRAPLKPLDEALAELLAQALPLAGDDTVDSFDADGRVLLADAVSPLQVPPQDNSAMDGYAVRSEEHTSELQSQSNLVCRLLLEKKKLCRVRLRHQERPSPQQEGHHGPDPGRRPRQRRLHARCNARTSPRLLASPRGFPCCPPRA